MPVFNIYKYFCKECGWMGNELEKSGCVTYADEWFICPKCKRDASESIAHNKALGEMTKEEALEYGAKIISVFPEHLSIRDVLFVLETLLESTRDAIKLYSESKN